MTVVKGIETLKTDLMNKRIKSDSFMFLFVVDIDRCPVQVGVSIIRMTVLLLLLILKLVSLYTVCAEVQNVT